MSLTIALGIVVALCIVININRCMTMHRNVHWHTRRLDGVKHWVRVTVEGLNKAHVVVRTSDGTFRVRPVGGVLYRTELLPLRNKKRLSLIIIMNGTRRLVSGCPPFAQTLDDTGVSVSVARDTPRAMWSMEDLEKVSLSQGGLLHSDRKCHNGVSVLFVPGKSSPMVDRRMFESFRRQNIRIHVLYYENHTFALDPAHIDCGFASGSLHNSLQDMKQALLLTGARMCIAYSLGALLLTTFLKENPKWDLDAVVLLHPFLSLRGWSRMLESQAGLLCLKSAATFLPTVNGQRVIPKMKHRFHWIDYMAFKYPISVKNPIHADKSRMSTLCTLDFVCVTLRAILALQKKREKIKIPVLLVGGTQDDICCAKTNIRTCNHIFERVEIKTYKTTHFILPGPDEDKDAEIVRQISNFLASWSHNIVFSAAT